MSFPSDGTVTELVEWIGTSPVRARTAIDAEHERDTPRKGVIDAAEKVLADAPPRRITYRRTTDGVERTITANTPRQTRYDLSTKWERVD